MSVRRLDPHQPKSFAFSEENLAWAHDQLKKYPEGRQAAAVLPLLWRAQEQNEEWLPEPAIRVVADMLEMPYIRVYEIATFYTMFNLSPVGRFHIQICGTTPCMLRGASDLKAVCERMIGKRDTVTNDGVFSWTEVECLGACVNAPMIQISKDYYEDLDTDTFKTLLDNLRNGRPTHPGPQTDRQLSAPAGGPTTLLDPEIYKSGPSPAHNRSGARADQEKEIHNTAQAATAATSPVKTPEVKSGDTAKAAEMEARFKREEGPPDDFMKFGLNADSQKALNEMGLTRYGQVQSLTQEDRDWIEMRQPRFKGKTAEWIEQAKALVSTNTPGGAAPDVAGTRQGKTKDED